jgi:hypothetical protein
MTETQIDFCLLVENAFDLIADPDVADGFLEQIVSALIGDDDMEVARISAMMILELEFAHRDRPTGDLAAKWCELFEPMFLNAA